MQGARRRTLIEARGLRKAFGASLVLRDVDLTLEAGETLAVLGPNGAGKSTLLRLLACISRPSAGTLRLFGEDCHPGRPTPDVLGRMGFVGHEPLVYEDLTPRQNLELYARLYGARGAEDGASPAGRARASLAHVGLAHVMERATRALSRGMLQRLAIARATLHRPELLLLDEPFTALDESGTELLAGELRSRAAAGTSVVLVTHDLRRAAQLADRVLVLAAGRVAGDLGAARDEAQLARDYRAVTGPGV
jgi:heme ABC exporter ATP-binding subunit CcmA